MQPLLFTPRRFGDARGWFAETYQSQRFAALGLDVAFVQDNEAFSGRVHTLRGLHYQAPPHGQAKLVRCVAGSILDVIVDVRRGSPTFGQHHAVELSGENGAMLFVPLGYAHAYLTLSANTLVSYKVTGLYAREAEGGVRFNDPALSLRWPVDPALFIVNDRDRNWPDLSEAATPFADDGAAFALKTVSL